MTAGWRFYLYFNLSDDAVVFHYMGEPSETRHLVVRNRPGCHQPKLVHPQCQAAPGIFVYLGMVGENQAFDDMDAVSMKDLK